jgi:hypothetical protein
MKLNEEVVGYEIVEVAKVHGTFATAEAAKAVLAALKRQAALGPRWPRFEVVPIIVDIHEENGGDD